MTESNLVTILMAEDDPRDRHFAVRLLQASRLLNPLACFNNGQELLDHLRAECAASPDGELTRSYLVLLDLNMPVLDGWKTLVSIRRDPALAHLPVLVLSVSDDEMDRCKSYELGANWYVTKPITLPKIASVLERLQQDFGIIIMSDTSDPEAETEVVS